MASTTEDNSKQIVNDESDEEDEDYVPPTNDGSDEDTNRNGAQHDVDATKESTLSWTKQRAVDDAFADLFGVTTSAAASTTESSKIDSKSKPKKIKMKSKKALKKMKKKKQILSDIFGSSAAVKMIHTSASTTANGKRKNDDQSVMKNSKFPSWKKRIVTEKKVFAGQTIEIQRTVLESSSDGTNSGISNDPRNAADNTVSNTAIDKTLSSNNKGQGSKQEISPKPFILPPKKAASGIDAVLQKIAVPHKKISTMDKTNVDWENYKDRTGLEDELKKKAVSNDAYLVKKDFLQRVDLRRFEQEKDERNRKRAAQQASK